MCIFCGYLNKQMHNAQQYWGLMVVERHICQIDLNCKTVKLMYWGQLSELSCHSLIIGKIHYNHNIQFTMKSFCFIYTVTISCLLCWTQFSLAVIGYNVWTLSCDLIIKWKKIMCRWFSCTNRWLLHICV